MARPGSGARLALGLLLLITGSGCTFHLQYLEDGSLFDLEEFDALAVGEDDRASILARLGPPDVVRYTLEDEELVYRTARHQGTDLHFIVPTDVPGVSIFGSLRGLLLAGVSPEEPPEEFEQELHISLPQQAIGTIMSFVGVPGHTDGVSLQGRRLRYDRFRLRLDRRTTKLRQKSYEPAVPVEKGIFREAFIRD